MNSFELLSSKKLTPVNHKRSRRNVLTIYFWTLERFVSTAKSEFQYDIFPSNSELDDITINLKKILLIKLNLGNAFDFPYLPKEKDFLSIQKEKKADTFLNFVFIKGQWVEEKFIGTMRNLLGDKYRLIEKGEIRLAVS